LTKHVVDGIAAAAAYADNLDDGAGGAFFRKIESHGFAVFASLPAGGGYRGLMFRNGI